MSEIAIAILIATFIAMALILIYTIRKIRPSEKKIEYDQHLMTDKELIQVIAKQPGGIASVKQLANITSLSPKQLSARLIYFYNQGIVRNQIGAGFKGHYSLIVPIDERPAPKLSEKPFLTVEDILTLFKHHNHQLTLQKICMDTGLPISIINREMKYFIKEKIVNTINTVGQYDKTFILKEPYRSDPDIFLKKQEEIDFELEDLLEEEIIRVRRSDIGLL